jgi:hypothetical protein
MIAAYLLVAAGVLLLVVGAIVFAFWVMFVPQVFIIEDRRNFDAVWRSRFLIGKGVWAEMIVLLIIVGILGALIGGVVGAVFGVSGSVVFGVEEGGFTILLGIVMGVVQALILPINQIAVVLLYYDSRIRKEGFDLEILAREMGTALPAAGPAVGGGPGPGLQM